MRTFYVYILANHSRTLYIGVTNDIERRMFEHKTRRVPGFTGRYDIDRLIYYEEVEGPTAAIARRAPISPEARPGAWNAHSVTPAFVTTPRRRPTATCASWRA